MNYRHQLFTAAADGSKRGFSLCRIVCLTALLVIFAANGVRADVEINETNFPDPYFRYYVKEYCQPDGDNLLTDDEIAWVTEINAVEMGISNLKGVEYLTELKYLDVSFNNLGQLDLSQNTKLVRLDCGSNQLTSLNLSKNTELRMLFCTNNQLTSLIVSNNAKLRYLYCSGNQIDAAGMKKLVESMPLYSPESQEDPPYGTLQVIDHSVNDQNFITAAQVKLAKAKNWKVVAYSTNGGQQDYTGSMGVPINDTTFPDPNFQSWVRSNCDTDEDGFLSYEEIAEVKEIDVKGKSIANLTGIEYFAALTILVCSNNQLTALDVSKNTALTSLVCVNNQLTALDVSKNTALVQLLINNNQLTNIDVSMLTGLKTLWCSDNQITALDLSQNTALVQLTCAGNELTSLDLSQNTALVELICGDNPLTALNVSKNTALISLNCCLCQIKGENMLNFILSLPKNTTGQEHRINMMWNNFAEGNFCTKEQVKIATELGWTVYWNDNGWKVYEGVIAIDETNFPDPNFRAYLLEQDYGQDGVLTDEEIAEVKEIDVKGKSITNLTGIEYFAALTILVCSNNQLTALDVSKNTALTSLVCVNNQLTALDVSSNTALVQLLINNNQLTNIDVSMLTGLKTLWCSDNQITALDLSQNTALVQLTCAGNELTSLDLSQNTALVELICGDNPLTALNVSKNTALISLNCCLCQIKGENMLNFILSLPKNTTGQEHKINMMWNNFAEGNFCTKVQVKIATELGWTVYWNDNGWKVYEGIDIPGDANGDGEVNAADLETIRDYILGLDPQPFSFESANLNGDSEVDIQDLTLLIQLLTE